MTGLCFAVMFPQLPGYIGVYQFAVVAILSNTSQWMNRSPERLPSSWLTGCHRLPDGLYLPDDLAYPSKLPTCRRKFVSEDKPQQVT